MILIIQSVLFTVILIYASIIDFKKQIVPTHICILLLFTGLLNVSLYSFLGFAFVFIPLFVVGLITNSLGGGDIKLAGMCGFVLQGVNGLIGTIIGVTIALVIVSIYQHIRKENKPFALVPYLSIGYIIINLIKFK